MALETDIRLILYLKYRAVDLIKQVNDRQRTVVYTQNGEPQGILHNPGGNQHQSKKNAFGLYRENWPRLPIESDPGPKGSKKDSRVGTGLLEWILRSTKILSV